MEPNERGNEMKTTTDKEDRPTPTEQPKELLDCGHYIWEHGPRGRCPK